MRWEEKKEIEQNKIDTINNLAVQKELKKTTLKNNKILILLLYYFLSYTFNLIIFKKLC